MTPVTIIEMPHNYRGELYPEGEGPSFDAQHEPGTPRMSLDEIEFATLPIPMPQCLMLSTDADGRVIGAVTDAGLHIRWADLDVVLRGVEQFNADIASRDPDAGL
jgi:hypothetical protein